MDRCSVMSSAAKSSRLGTRNDLIRSVAGITAVVLATPGLRVMREAGSHEKQRLP
jgi:hypothetical protein